MEQQRIWTQPQRAIAAYAAQHDLYTTLQQLTEKLICVRPDRPVDFMIQSLRSGAKPLILLLGPPEHQMNDIAVQLGDALKLPLISTSALLKEAVQKQTTLGLQVSPYLNSNQLVPDALMQDLLSPVLNDQEFVKDGVILEGYPVTTGQWRYLQQSGHLPSHVVVLTGKNETQRQVAFHQAFKKLKAWLKPSTSSTVEYIEVDIRQASTLPSLLLPFFDLASPPAKLRPRRSRASPQMFQVAIAGKPCPKLGQFLAKKYHAVYIHSPSLLKEQLSLNDRLKQDDCLTFGYIVDGITEGHGEWTHVLVTDSSLIKHFKNAQDISAWLDAAPETRPAMEKKQEKVTSVYDRRGDTAKSGAIDFTQPQDESFQQLTDRVESFLLRGY